VNDIKQFISNAIPGLSTCSFLYHLSLEVVAVSFEAMPGLTPTIMAISSRPNHSGDSALASSYNLGLPY